MTNIDEATLTKGQLRKLEALRKSLGPKIADKAMAEWLAKQPAKGNGKAEPVDEVAQKIAKWLQTDLQGETLPRGGYLVKRGRGRIIVEPAK